MKKKPVTRERFKGDKKWAVVYTKPNPEDDESSLLEVAYSSNSLMKAEVFVERRWSKDKQENGWTNYSVEEVEKGRRHNCFKELHKKVMKCTDCLTDIYGAYYWNGVAYCEPCFQYAKENETQ